MLMIGSHVGKILDSNMHTLNWPALMMYFCNPETQMLSNTNDKINMINNSASLAPLLMGTRNPILWYFTAVFQSCIHVGA